jgi:hypothetical protein
LSLLGQAEELLCQLVRRLIFGLDDIKLPQAPQEALRSLAYLAAEFERPGVGLFHFRGRIALRHHERQGQSDVQIELVLEALSRVGQSLE